VGERLICLIVCMCAFGSEYTLPWCDQQMVLHEIDENIQYDTLMKLVMVRVDQVSMWKTI